MELKRSLVVCLISLWLPLHAYAQPWSTILDPSRAIVWSPGVPGGIPTSWPACTTAQAGVTVPVVAYTGSSSAINTALSNCAAANPAGSYLQLAAGTFTLSDSITMYQLSNLILRGSGPLATFLNFNGVAGSGAGSQIVVHGSNMSAGSGNVGSNDGQEEPCMTNAPFCANWTAGYAMGGTSITLTNVGSGGGGIKNGDVIILDQANVLTDNGGWFVCDSDATTQCQWKGGVGGQSGRLINGLYHSQQQLVKVVSGCSSFCTGVGPFTLTISPGLYGKNWNGAGVNTGAWWVHPTGMVGIENLTVDGTNTAADSSYKSLIQFLSLNGGWVKNVRGIEAQRNHAWVLSSNNIEVRDSYFYGNRTGGSQSYGIECYPGFSTLVENNVFQQVGAPIMSAGGSGNVFAYNFSRNGGPSGAESYMGASYPSHDPGTMFNLFESNQFANGLFADTTWGTSGQVTLFRNWLGGLDYEGPTLASVQTNPIALNSYNRIYNIIGNVLGTPGYHNGANSAYETYPTTSNPPVSTWSAGTATQCNRAIYVFGWGSGTCGVEGNDPVSDPLVRNTAMRWGNYDTFNAAVRWDSTESSPGSVAYVNAQSTPASRTLPSSFYLSSKPLWWGTLSYPAIGPDVANGTGPGGYAHNIPAANCYYTVLTGPADGTGSPLAFDASTCYQLQAQGPLPPTPPIATIR